MRRLLLLTGAIVFLDTVFFAALTPLLPHYVDELGFSKAGAGVLQAAYPAGTLVGSLPSGFVAARFGVKPTAVAGLLMVCATSVAFGWAGEAWQLDAARFAQGLASSFSWTGALAWLVAAAPAERRGQLIGTVFGVAIGGALFGPVLGGIASKTGTGPAFSAVAAIMFAQAVWALLSPSARPAEPQPFSALFDALHSPRVLAGLGFVTLPALMFGTLSVLGPLRLSHLGFGSLAIGGTFLVSAGFEATLSPAIGRFSDRRGRRLPIIAGVTASAVVLAVLPWPNESWLFAALVVCAGIAFGSLWTPAMSLMTDAAEACGLEYGWAFSLLNLAWAPGQVLGSSAGGAIAKATTDAVVYLTLAGLCAASLVALRRR